MGTLDPGLIRVEKLFQKPTERTHEWPRTGAMLANSMLDEARRVTHALRVSIDV